MFFFSCHSGFEMIILFSPFHLYFAAGTLFSLLYVLFCYFPGGVLLFVFELVQNIPSKILRAHIT